MGNMKTWWIFGFERWGNLRPAGMETRDGVWYNPLFAGIWIRTRDKCFFCSDPKCKNNECIEKLMKK